MSKANGTSKRRTIGTYELQTFSSFEYDASVSRIVIPAGCVIGNSGNMNGDILLHAYKNCIQKVSKKKKEINIFFKQ